MDFLIKDGWIVDGTGGPRFKGDVWVDEGRIAKIGNDPSLKVARVIEADDMVVSPGFIDIHTHSDFGLLWDPYMERKIRQGVTTEVIGNCGISAAPLLAESMADLKAFFSSSVLGVDRVKFTWRTMSDYLSLLDKQGIGLNIATLVGHTIIRLNVLGFEKRQPNQAEMERMKKLVHESMGDGAFGLSTGLFEIAPANYASTSEVAELCKVVAEHDGIHASHMRSYPSPDEVIQIAEISGVKTHIAHYGSMNAESMKKLEEARRREIDITFDLYPYTAGMVYITFLLPESLQGGGAEKIMERLRDPEVREAVKREDPSIVWLQRRHLKWERILVAYCEKNRSLQGKTFAEIARMRVVDPIDALFDLYVQEKGKVMVVGFGGGRTEESVLNAYKHPRSMVGSDSVEPPYDRHPRSYGTHARVLRRYVREMKALTLEEAIMKMTYLPAQTLEIHDRGLIREGMCADLAVFDPKEIADRSTYEQPDVHATGVRYVMVNGRVVFDDGEITREPAGRVLRHNA